VWVKQISCCKLQGVNGSPRQGTGSVVITIHLKCCSFCTCPSAGGSPGLSRVCVGVHIGRSSIGLGHCSGVGNTRGSTALDES